MDIQKIDRILQETAYVRTGGTPEELRCALYLQQQCKELGYDAGFGAGTYGDDVASFAVAEMVKRGMK